METNKNKWDKFYEKIPTHHHAQESYMRAAKFLQTCSKVEDWGVGHGGFLKYRPDAIGIDGSNTPFARKKYVDLTQYTSPCDGIHIRHVLEHNYEWKKIIENALKSAKKRIVVTFFIPMAVLTRLTEQLCDNNEIGINVPDLRISEYEFSELIKNHVVYIENIKSPETRYGWEQIVYIHLAD